jgi:hypothetical protein
MNSYLANLAGFIILILSSTISCAQTTIASGYFGGRQFKGYIFPKEYVSSLVHFDDAKQRYTPTEEDVSKAELLIKDQLPSMNGASVKRGKTCPMIHKTLSRYNRQYMGYIDEKGKKVVWVNFIIARDKPQTGKLGEHIIVVLDGCSNYWNIKVNLDEGKVYDLRVNGSA